MASRIAAFTEEERAELEKSKKIRKPQSHQTTVIKAEAAERTGPHHRKYDGTGRKKFRRRCQIRP